MARLRRVETSHPRPGSVELAAYWRDFYAHFKPIDRAHREKLVNGVVNRDQSVEEHMHITAEKRAWEARAGLKFITGRGYELRHFE